MSVQSEATDDVAERNGQAKSIAQRADVGDEQGEDRDPVAGQDVAQAAVGDADENEHVGNAIGEFGPRSNGRPSPISSQRNMRIPRGRNVDRRSAQRPNGDPLRLHPVFGSRVFMRKGRAVPRIEMSGRVGKVNVERDDAG